MADKSLQRAITVPCLARANVGKVGRIKSGEYAGFSVRIDDDSRNTGGYLILLWKDATSTGYDDWVKDLTDLDAFFRESGWDMEWLE
jgi:hypothetical protein